MVLSSLRCFTNVLSACGALTLYVSLLNYIWTGYIDCTKMSKSAVLMKNILGVYSNFSKYPFGKFFFSKLFAMKAPYFRTINPMIEDLKNGHVVVTMKQKWSVENHIKTVHAIAVCNLVETAMGLIMEASIPPHLRWLPMGMDVDYLKKATGKLTATSTLDEKFFELKEYPGRVDVPVDVTDSKGVLVTKAKVKVWLSKKPEK